MRVLLVDDSAVVRLGLRTLLEQEPDLAVVAEAGDGEEALRAARVHRPEVVLLDVRMPRRDGLSVVAELARGAKVLMTTFSAEPEVIRRALALGACGYLVHGTFDAAALPSMVRCAAAGVTALAPPATEALRQGSGPAGQRVPGNPARALLRGRQAEVMELVAKGHGNKQIAAELFLAEKTVKNHINQIFAALGVSSRAEAIVAWLDPDPAEGSA